MSNILSIDIIKDRHCFWKWEMRKPAASAEVPLSWILFEVQKKPNFCSFRSVEENCSLSRSLQTLSFLVTHFGSYRIKEIVYFVNLGYDHIFQIQHVTDKSLCSEQEIHPSLSHLICKTKMAKYEASKWNCCHGCCQCYHGIYVYLLHCVWSSWSMQLDDEVLEKFKREAAMHQNERWEEM